MLQVSRNLYSPLYTSFSLSLVNIDNKELARQSVAISFESLLYMVVI